MPIPADGWLNPHRQLNYRRQSAHRRGNVHDKLALSQRVKFQRSRPEAPVEV